MALISQRYLYGSSNFVFRDINDNDNDNDNDNEEFDLVLSMTTRSFLHMRISQLYRNYMRNGKWPRRVKIMKQMG